MHRSFNGIRYLHFLPFLGIGVSCRTPVPLNRSCHSGLHLCARHPASPAAPHLSPTPLNSPLRSCQFKALLSTAYLSVPVLPIRAGPSRFVPRTTPTVLPILCATHRATALLYSPAVPFPSAPLDFRACQSFALLPDQSATKPSIWLQSCHCGAHPCRSQAWLPILSCHFIPKPTYSLPKVPSPTCPSGCFLFVPDLSRPAGPDISVTLQDRPLLSCHTPNFQ